jgi:hypothetical protein
MGNYLKMKKEKFKLTIHTLQQSYPEHKKSITTLVRLIRQDYTKHDKYSVDIITTLIDVLAQMIENELTLLETKKEIYSKLYSVL